MAQTPGTLALALALAWLPTARAADSPLQNGDFEQGNLGEMPPGWKVPAELAKRGNLARLVATDGAGGAQAVEISWANGPEHDFANLLQGMDARPMRGLRVQVEARVRLVGESPSAMAQMWVRVDTEDKTTGFFDNMHDRPVRSRKWTEVRITGRVDNDADRLVMGFMAIGDTRLQVDDVHLTVLDPSARRSEQRELAERIQRFVDAVDERRGALRVPGAVLAIVSQGRVVRVESLGTAQPGSDIPLPIDVRFLAASVSKPVAASAIATVVAEGDLSWDTPVRSLVPEYHLQDPAWADEVTMTDLLAHRVGMARMDLLWMTGVQSLDPLLRAMGRATPLSKPREALRYDNIGFTVAGLAAARAADTDWATLLTERVLQPLKMRHSSADPATCLDDPQLAAGFKEDPLGMGWAPDSPLDTTVIAPAGGLCTTVPDLARWVAALQGEGDRFLDPDAREAMWAPVGKGATWSSWARGWRLDEWEGERIVHHEGNLPAHGSAVGLMPGAELGWVLFINRKQSPLQAEVRHLAARLLLEPAPTDPPAPLTTGSWSTFTLNQSLQVRAQGSTLWARIPGLPGGPLVATSRGWRIQGSDALLTAGEGGSPGLSLRSSGLTLPAGYLDPIEPPDVEPGVYQTTLGPLVVDEQDGRLAVRLVPDVWMPMTQLQPRLAEILLAGELSHDLPVLPELSAIQDAIQAALGPAPGSTGPLRLAARFDAPALGLDDPGILEITEVGRGSLVSENPDFGETGTAWDGDRTTLVGGPPALQPTTATEFEAMGFGWITWLWRDWTADYASVRLLHRDFVDGQDLAVLRFERHDGDWFDLSVDTATWLPFSRLITTGVADPRSQQGQSTERFDDWTRFGDGLLPARVWSENPVTGEITITLFPDGPQLHPPPHPSAR